MSELRTIGISSIEMGAIAVDGGMGTSLEDVGKIYKDSAEITQDDAEVTDFFSEQNDDPEESVEKKGKKTLKFSIMDYTPDTLAKFLGGTVTGTTTDVWNDSATAPKIEQSLKIDTGSVIIKIPRGRIRAKLNLKMAKGSIGLIDVTVQVLTPSKTGVESITIEPKV